MKRGVYTKLFQKITSKVLIASVILLVTLAGVIQEASALTWSTETPLISSTVSEYSPAMAQTADGRIWLLWHKYVSGKSQIFYNIYDGLWSGETQLTTDLSSNVNPAIVQALDGTIWVFWSSDRIGPAGNWEIYYRTSSNNGASWSADTRLTMDVSADSRPSVMQAQDGKIWVVWYSNRFGNNDLFYTTYDGSWTSFGVQLTSDLGVDKDPAIVQVLDGTIWVFWSSYRSGDYELWYKTSIDNGVSWQTETQLTSASSWDELPSATLTLSGRIWVAWQADRSGSDYDIYYKTFDGFVWSSDVRIVSDNDEDILPSIYRLANSTIWVTWATSRNGDFDIYYKYILADYDVAVKSITAQSTLAYQGYNRQVQVKVRNEGLLSATFSVTAYYNSSPIGTQAVTGLASHTETTLTFLWDTTGLAYGNYVLSATASGLVGEEDLTDNSLSGDVVLLTIPGDVNGDKIVNVVDAASNSAHWYPGPPIGPLGYSITNDIDIDGSVGIVDSAIVSAHWGQSW